MSFDLFVILCVPALFLAFLMLEALLRTGRSFPAIRGWRLVGALGLAVTLAINALVPPLVLSWLPGWRLVDFTPAGLWGAVPAFAAATFLAYWAHRLQHWSDLLWRLFGHQLHHSVQRVDISSALIIHPFDVAFQTSLTAIAVTLLGVTGEAAALAGLMGFAAVLYQHLNVRTPRWTGYLIQRPEAHMLHHERGVHARNFGDLPLWDMLFGTFVNPERADVAVGFAPERSRRVLAMLVGRDVNRDADKEAGRGAMCGGGMGASRRGAEPCKSKVGSDGEVVWVPAFAGATQS